jgi:membrane AbrB-like protein
MSAKLPVSVASRFLMTCAISLVGVCLFSFIHLPIPWLLGPMLAVLIGSKWAKLPLVWPSYLRDTGILIVGYSMGLSLTRDALVEIVRQLPSMLLMTVTLLTLCTLVAFLISKLSGVDFPTMLTASIPGGLTQVIILAEEFKHIDIAVVTFFQVIRLMMLVFFVPLLLFSPLFGAEHASTPITIMQSSGPSWVSLFPNILIFAPVCLFSVWAGKKIKLPTAIMLGPMAGTAIVQLFGFQGPALPSLLLNLSQLMIGTYVGLLLQSGHLKRKVRTISMAFLSGTILIVISLGLCALLIRMHPIISSATGFLSMAPGGMDQMGIMAHEVGADLSVVTGYQTFRLLFIYFVVSAVLRSLFRYSARRKMKYLETKENNLLQVK